MKDYYIENGMYVFTAHFLKKRNYCCKNGCRHCPYGNDAKKVGKNDQKTNDLKKNRKISEKIKAK